MKQRKIRIQLEFQQELPKVHRGVPSHFAFEFRICCVTSLEDRPAELLQVPTRPAPISLVWPVHFKDSVACCCGSHDNQGQ